MAEEKSSLYERQWNEAHAIQAIYPDEYEEVKPAWNVSAHPPHFVLHLKTGTAALDVDIQLTARYPLDPPIVSLSRRKGLLAGQVSDLHGSIGELAKGCTGREMVFDLVEHAKEALHAFGQKKVSFHDQMLLDRQQRVKVAEAELAAERKEVLEIESKIQEELQRKQQALVVDDQDQDPHEYVRFDPELVFYEPGLDFAKYIDQVRVLRVVGRKDLAATALPYTECDVEFDGNQLSMQRFSLDDLAKRVESEKLERRMDNFLKRVNDVGLLSYNPHIVRTIGAQCNERELMIVSEKTHALPLARLPPPAAADLKVLFKQLAVGLDHIHQSNYIHKDLRLDVLYLDEASMTIQIGDIHVHHEMNVLLHREDFPTPATWLPSELKEKNLPVTRKTDVWFLGVIFVQLLYGHDVTARHPNWGALKSAVGPASQLVSLLDSIFQASPNYRPATTDILKHEYFDGVLPVGHLTQGKAFSGTPKGKGNANSRFENDFEQLELLGRGGFGEVVKARNRVDNRFYAIKKINLDPENVEYNRKILREVMTLSRLQHDRVVRYFQAWVEGTSQHLPAPVPPEDATLSSGGELSDSDTSDGVEFVNTSRDWLGGGSLLDHPAAEDPSTELSLMKLNRTGFSESEESLQDSTPATLASNEELLTVHQTLYIQMEYCPKRTLRDLIDEGLEPGETWRLFRQIVEGLAYIHSQGMIHRDLKPSNIFMDYQGNVKIGDFGLATSSVSFSSLRRPKTAAKEHSASFNESLTAGIGTPFYTSPEQDLPKARYNHKVDMYSLGIIFLEMWCRFDTAMERAECLKAARAQDIVLPGMFEAGDLAPQRSLLLNLLSHDSKQRLSSADLLLSDLLPVRIENEQVNGVMRSVTNPVNPAFSTLIELLFHNTVDALKDFAYDFHSGNVAEPDLLARMAVVKQLMVKVFSDHGAVDTSVPLFQLSTVERAESVHVLDTIGQRLDLPFDLTRPFARFVARNGISEYRRFAFDRIFRKSVLPGGQPRQPVECDFDIVFSHGDGLVEEAEVVKVAVDGVMAVCGCSQQQLTLVLGDLALAKLVALSLGVDEGAFVECLQEIQHFGLQKRVSVLLGKYHGAPADRLDRLGKLAQWDPARPQVLYELLGKHSRSAEPVVAHLLGLVELLRGPLGLRQCSVVVDPLFVHNPAVYSSGLVFQLLLLCSHGGARKRKAIEVLAAGGRYDQLVSHYKYPSACGTFTGTVGVAFSVNKLAGLVASGPDTVQCWVWPSADELPADDLLSVAAFLWDNGVCAKVVHRCEAERLEALTSLARPQGVKYIVVVLSGKRTVYKVRDVDKLIDNEVARTDLLAFLQSDPGAPPRPQSGPEYNVVLLGSLSHRLHGTQRAVITDKAIRAVSALHLHAPPTALSLVIHDVQRELIRKVFDLVDDKRIIEALGGAERDNLDKVKGVRDRCRDNLEPVVCFYSQKENVVDIMVTR